MPPDHFIQNLERLQTELPHMAARAMAYTSLWMEQYAKPNAPWTDRTANLRNSIQAGVTRAQEDEVEGALSMGYLGFGESMEYARRIELGFVGEDSLGRTYNQSPYPIIWPTVQLAANQHIFERAMQAELQQFLGTS